MSKVYHGSCLCRSITYEATGEPFTFIVCHCSNCRKFSGSSFASNASFPPDKFVITHGKENIKRYDDPDTKSGHVLHRWFCPTCGSSIFVSNETNKFKIVAAGTMDDELTWLPKKESFPECKRPWVVGIKTAPSKPRVKL